MKVLVRQIAKLLANAEVRVVFAESCTAGMVSATLAQQPGISAYLCGSSVVYREATKTAWLSISPDQLRNDGAVSGRVAARLAQQVLTTTPEAMISVAVVGHLGPEAPAKLDGVIQVAVSKRVTRQDPDAAATDVLTTKERFKLSSTTRLARQREATQIVLQVLRDSLLQSFGSDD